MTTSIRSVMKKALLVSTAVVGAAGLASSPASAGISDSFTVKTSDGCGSIKFDDYGPGAPGSGNNDDYAVIRDNCKDGHGVQAGVSLNGQFLGLEYNGKGNGKSVIWDPFKAYGNVKKGDQIEMVVCLVDGEGDQTPFSCKGGSHISIDG